MTDLTSPLMPTSKAEWLLHSLLNRLFNRRDIVINDKLYLRRWYLKGRGTGEQWFLHNIRLPDEGRDYHDHPWPFHTTILSGGYSEEVLFSNCTYGAGPRTFIKGDKVMNGKATFRHRITAVLPNTYTLVKAGKAVRTWGFWVKRDRIVPGGELFRWVDYREYLELPEDVEVPLEDRWQ